MGLSFPLTTALRGSRTSRLAQLLPLLAVAYFVGLCAARGSDAPRGVAVGFVFDPAARCEPPCKHAGVCIRNNTCFCNRGYEGETCQYGDVKTFFTSYKDPPI